MVLSLLLGHPLRKINTATEGNLKVSRRYSQAFFFTTWPVILVRLGKTEPQFVSRPRKGFPSSIWGLKIKLRIPNLSHFMAGLLSGSVSKQPTSCCFPLFF